IATTTGSGNVGTTVTGSTSYTVIGGSDQGNILFHSFQDFSPQVEVRASSGRWQPRLSEAPTAAQSPSINAHWSVLAARSQDLCSCGVAI
ncbi:MAG: hypothetical protein AAFR12_22675, partial [Cyanobacteria bacterium J06626_6]